MPILITGAAGFIGFHLSKSLLENGYEVFGIDNLNNYYDVSLKLARLKELERISLKEKINFRFSKIDIADTQEIINIFKKYNFKKVVNLAAQAGVRYSIENPSAYINSNIVGFNNIIEACRNFNIEHFVYASSSSVYGGNKLLPFSEGHSVDHPVSLYAATKRSNELVAHTYSHLYNLPSTGLRFFTVYGEWGRPDMALFKFTKNIIEDKPIEIFNRGDMVRDFTYVNDIVNAIMLIIFKTPQYNGEFNFKNPDPGTSWSPFKILNIGNSKPTKLMEYIEAIERHIGKKSKKIMLPMQPGDVKETSSDTKRLEEYISFKPSTSIDQGIKNFVNWYVKYFEKKILVEKIKNN